MNTLSYGDKWLPRPPAGGNTSPALRVVNISNGSGMITVQGGKSYIYNTNAGQTDINNLQFRRKGSTSWQTVPNDGAQISCAQNAYVDFKYVNTKGSYHLMNEGLTLTADFIKISADMDHELSGQLDLLQLDKTTGSNKFQALFYNDINLKHASALVLPTNTSDNDYSQLFEMCTGLITPPQQSFTATTSLGSHCFQAMFNLCQSLTAAMNLAPTAYVGWECCKNMYSHCSSLKKPATMDVRMVGANGSQFESMYAGSALTGLQGISFANLGIATQHCCELMFNSCEALIGAAGFTLAPTILADSCYKSMFMGCSMLTIPPAMPAVTIPRRAYAEMFYGCTDLMYPPEELSTITTVKASGCAYMFNHCVQMEADDLDLSRITTLEGDYQFLAMFRLCNKLNPSSILMPVVSIADSIGPFAYMFQQCTDLTDAPELNYTVVGENGYKGMFSHCSSLTGAPILNVVNSEYLGNRCYLSMFEYCTSLHYIENKQDDWFLQGGSVITLGWVMGVPKTGVYKCSETILNDSTKQIFDRDHIPYDRDNHWELLGSSQAEPFTRYQDKSTGLKNQWEGLSAYV